MGTVNYYSSKFVTVGLNPDNYEDYEDEDGLIIQGSRYELMGDMFHDVEHLYTEMGLKDNSAYTVKVEPGYYEGFSIVIKDEYSYFDDEEERAEATAEIEKIFNFLNEAVDIGCCVCHPSWCTSYEDYTESKKSLESAKAAALKECSEKPDSDKWDEIRLAKN